MDESQVFTNALELASPAERAAYLDAACAGDPRLRADVEALLRAHLSHPGFLEQPAGALADISDADPAAEAPESAAAEQPGVVLAGRYKLLEQIGEGGMGSVWMAQQQEPVRRPVAVKLIKPGMDSKTVLARFEAERQALALMDHPNIAKVHDAGTTSDGRPFFVMELVKGRPITKFCDDHHLTPQQRLELFVPVCQAVQHAHQKGVIHRDLKPSNVLVALYDDRPVPKVIDFGIAKAAGQILTEQTLHTSFGAVVGTVEYMSPEQASFNQLDVDTRSDVYSLGVLLYELLTGSPPFTAGELGKAGVLEMLRVVREQEPTKPSAKLSTAVGLPTLAANRGTEPKRLTRLVRGELDWIVMKSLEKDRNRRYETANGLARDLQRYLADEVVEARPPGAAYRLRKFVKRNRGPVVAAALLVLLLLGGIAGTTVGLMIARHQRDEADRARFDEAREADRAIAAEKLASNRLAQVEAEKQRADEERDVAQAVNDFVQRDLLGQVDIDNQSGGEGPRDPDIKVRTVLDRAAKTIGARFANRPRVEAAIRLTIANAYYALGNYPEARLHAERSVELRTAHLGADHADTLSSQCVLGLVLFDLGQIERAEALFEVLLRQRTATLGPDHLATLQSKHFLAYAYALKTPPEPDRAEVLLQDVVQKRTDLLGPNHAHTLAAKINLAWAYRQQGKLDRAAAMYAELLDVYTDRFGADNPHTLLTRNNLGLVYLAQGKYDQAEPLLLDVLQKLTALRGGDHPHTLAAQSFVASLYRGQKKYDQAAKLYEEILAKFKEKPGSTEDVHEVLSLLIPTLLEAKQPEKALPRVAELVNGERESLGADSPRFASTLARVSADLLKHEQYPVAEKHLRECLGIREKKEPDAWTTFNTQSMLGAALLGQKKYADAEPLLRQGYEGMKQREVKIPSQSRSRLTTALERLVQLYDGWNKPDETAKWRKELEAQKKAEKTIKPKEK